MESKIRATVAAATTSAAAATTAAPTTTTAAAAAGAAAAPARQRPLGMNVAAYVFHASLLRSSNFAFVRKTIVSRSGRKQFVDFDRAPAQPAERR